MGYFFPLYLFIYLFTYLLIFGKSNRQGFWEADNTLFLNLGTYIGLFNL